jgi:WD40 repeat protein
LLLFLPRTAEGVVVQQSPVTQDVDITARTGTDVAGASDRRASRRESASRFFFGDDVFISYARRDGVPYALSLARALESRGFTCDADLFASKPELRTPESVKRRLKRSSLLVVVGSPGAAGSKEIDGEIATFADARPEANIIPIDVGGAIVGAQWEQRVIGLRREVETLDALGQGQPSEAVVGRIVGAGGFTRRHIRMRRSLWASALGTFTIITIGVISSVVLAARAKDLATIAEARQLAGEAVRSRGESADELFRSTRAALLGLRTRVTVETESAMRQILALLPLKLKSHHLEGGTNAVLSPDGSHVLVVRYHYPQGTADITSISLGAARSARVSRIAAISASGRWLASTTDTSIVLTDLESQRVRELRLALGPDDAVKRLAVSGDGSLVAVTLHNGDIENLDDGPFIWHVTSGNVDTLAVHRLMSDLAFAADSAFLVAGGIMEEDPSGRSGFVRAWYLHTGDNPTERRTPTEIVALATSQPVTAVAISNDPQAFAVAHSTTVRLWRSVAPGIFDETARFASAERVSSLAFSSDRMTIAALSRNEERADSSGFEVAQWDADTYQGELIVDVNDDVDALVFDSLGSTIAARRTRMDPDAPSLLAWRLDSITTSPAYRAGDARRHVSLVAGRALKLAIDDGNVHLVHTDAERDRVVTAFRVRPFTVGDRSAFARDGRWFTMGLRNRDGPALLIGRAVDSGWHLDTLRMPDDDSEPVVSLDSDRLITIDSTSVMRLRVLSNATHDSEPPLETSRNVRDVVLSPDGQLALLMSVDRGATLIETRTGENVDLLSSTRPVTLAAFSDDARYVATADDAGTIRTFERSREEMLAEIRTQRPIQQLAVSSGGKYVAALVLNGNTDVVSPTLHVWSLAPNRLIEEVCARLPNAGADECRAAKAAQTRSGRRSERR